MTEKQALNEIFSNLQAGEKYGKISYWNYYGNHKMTYPYFSAVLYKTIKGNFFYMHYGSSAIKPNKTELQWLLDTIFKCTATDFLKKHITETQAKNSIIGYEKLTEGK